ncbi:MAG: metal ABC transporter substrate-binding protein [Clostridia bacterium]|nr:metal ABC transporter substrate-binding protein [Clostridia bacterium]
MFLKTIKKIFVCALIVAVISIGAVISFTACEGKDDGKISVVCTIFPEYDWAKEVIGSNDNVDLTLIMNNGTDLHSYQPTVEDIAKITSADLFIYVGGESDEWVEDALKNKVNANMQTINLVEVLGDKAKEEELVEGMQGEEEEGEEEEEEGPEYDEHVWLSLKNAVIFVNEIAAKLGVIDAENKDLYLENANTYTAKLQELDRKYQAAVDAKAKDTLLFGDRFPFRYLVEDYSLKYYAAFIGCSAETEASFETIAFLAGKVDACNLNTILIIETSDGSIANTIKENTTSKNQKILTLDSMQNTTLKSNKTYYSMMESNLEVLKEALK